MDRLMVSLTLGIVGIRWQTADETEENVSHNFALSQEVGVCPNPVPSLTVL